LSLGTREVDALYRSLGARANGGFAVSVPALPGCIGQRDTREDALANVGEAISLYIEDCRETGYPTPEAGEGR
jgi:predicted RNase H-like HicB family nuclease